MIGVCKISDRPNTLPDGAVDPSWYLDVHEAVIAAGFATEIDWSESIQPPINAEAFATEAIFVICNSGMKAQVASRIFQRVMEALRFGVSARTAFGHVGKCAAIDHIWKDQNALYQRYCETEDSVAFCESLPWIGGITKWHLAKNLGADVAKPDRHLHRLAASIGMTADRLCTAISRTLGFRIATVDVVLWRACNLGILRSERAAIAPEPTA